MRSIRSFLMTRLLIGASGVIAAAALAIYLVAARDLAHQFDRNLHDRVQGLGSLLFQHRDVVDFAFSDELMPEYTAPELPSYFQLWYEDGETLERCEALPDRDLLAGPPAEDGRWNAPLPDGRPGRWIAEFVEIHHVFPEEGPNRPDVHSVHIVVARGREELFASQRRLLGASVLGGLVLLALIGLVARLAVDRGLAPANRLAARVGALEVEDLPDELGLVAGPRELAPVVQKVEALVARVRAALERERRTTANIAHELRTPISELLTVAEVALLDADDTEGARQALGAVVDVSSRMGRAVSTLLELARLGGEVRAPERESVAVEELTTELVRSLGGERRERGLEIDVRVENGGVVDADPTVLRIALSNLLGNAIQHAPRESRVSCVVDSAARGWSIAVENDARDLDPEDLRHLCEPFWRKDGARVDRERAGLGLALTHALVERCGIELTFTLEGPRLRALLRDAAPAA